MIYMIYKNVSPWSNTPRRMELRKVGEVGVKGFVYKTYAARKGWKTIEQRGGRSTTLVTAQE